MNYLIGVDIGGTTIKGGLIKGKDLIRQIVQDTKASEGGETTLNVLKDVIHQLTTADTTAIGIGVPSVVDSEQGIVYHVQNIRNWDEVNLKSILEKEFDIPVYINNDANCFAMGERIYGLGQDYDNFVGITLGTGVGGGIIQKGKLLSDANCGSGEFGEMPYLGGKLEQYCGSFFFSRYKSTGYEIMKRVEMGDKEAREIMNEYSMHLAVLIKMIVLSVDPQAIIFGGAISNSFHLFEKEMVENLKDFPFPNSIRKLKILRSQLQNIGILGASALCY
ncbi:MAG: ROK family protein [Proteiniphilum sp.]|nr:ROK family protein [Proteiniphilum sp.]MDD3909071.1 ROK family protein [Proteiniphilum sp.]MDD4416582.1 ROK family protein [Proteiniphilum sp.]